MDTFDFLVTFGLKTPCCDSDVNLCTCAVSLDANNDVNEIPFNWEQEAVPLPDTIKTPINIPLLLEILKLDPNRTRANFLSNGFSVGFRVGFRGTLILLDQETSGQLDSIRVELKQQCKKNYAWDTHLAPSYSLRSP